MLYRFFLLLSRRRWLVFAAALAVSLAAGWQARRISLSEDMTAMIPRNDRAVGDFMAYSAAFRQLERMYLDISLPSPDADALAAVGDSMDRRLREIPGFQRITYRLDAEGQAGLPHYMMRMAPLILSEADLARIPALLDEAAVRAHLQDARKSLSGPQGMFLKKVVPFDPIGFSSLVFAKLDALKAGVGDVQPVEGRIVTADGRHLMIFAEPEFPSGDRARTRDLVGAVLAAAREVEAEHQGKGAKVAVTGGHRAALDNAEIVERDVKLTLSVSTAAMLLLGLAAYRRRWIALLTLVPTAFGALVAGAILSLAHEAVYAISVGFGIVLVGVAIDFAIHILFHIENDPAPGAEGRARQLAELAIPIATGGATTIGAFLLMAISPVTAHKQVALFAASALAATAAFSLAVLPLAVPLARASADPKPLPFAAFFAKLMAIRRRRFGLVLAVALAFTIFCAFGAARLRFEGDVRKLSGVTQETKADEKSVTDAWRGALSLSSAMARGRTDDEALEQNERLAAALEKLQAEGRVGAVSSLASLVPSAKSQRENAARWGAFWSPERRAEAARLVESASAGLGFRAGAFDPFFKLIAAAPEPIPLGDLLKSPPAPMIEPRVSRSESGVALGALFKPKDPSAADALRAALPGDDFAAVDGEALIRHVDALARRGLGWFALWAAGAAAVALILMMGSFELAFAVLAPLALGALWTFGVMGWLGLPVDVANFVFIIFIIGVGDDCCIFLATSRLAPLRGEIDRTDASGGSIIICTLTTLISCGALVLADHPALFSVGAACVLGMAGSFAAAVVFVPLIMDLLLKRATFSGAPRLWHIVGGVCGAAYVLGSEILLFGIVEPALRLFHRGSPESLKPRIRRYGRAGLKSLFTIFPYGRTRYVGFDAATFARPCIAVSNHQSAIDIPLIAGLPGDLRLTLKKRVWNAPWFGIAARKLGHVMVEPENPEGTLARCREVVAEGASIHFFAEGTRSPDGFLQRFHKGAFQLAVELGLDVMPIVLCDSRRCLPSSGYWVEPYTMTVRALPRVTPQTFDYSLGPRALMKHVKSLIAAGLQEDLDKLNTYRVVREKVRRRYRYHGPFVERSVSHQLHQSAVFPVLDALFPREGGIIEVGCGWGLRGHWLTEFTSARKYIGLDAREDRLSAARASLQSKRHASFEPLGGFDWRPEIADAIILAEGFDRMPAQERAALHDRAIAALRPGGLLVIISSRYPPPPVPTRAAGFQPVEVPPLSGLKAYRKPSSAPSEAAP